VVEEGGVTPQRQRPRQPQARSQQERPQQARPAGYTYEAEPEYQESI
jgi:hypothetical protein